jgi:hypothetical protein
MASDPSDPHLSTVLLFFHAMPAQGIDGTPAPR